MKDNNESKKNRLYGITMNNKMIVIYETDTIFEMDCFTTDKFDNKEDMYEKLNKLHGITFTKFFIEVSGQIKGGKQALKHNETYDIMYGNNILPKLDDLQGIYSDYLLEDRKRLKTSFSYYMPRLKEENIYKMEESEVRLQVKNRIKSYKKMRRVYFELLKNGKIKLSNTNKEKPLNDYARSLISNIDTNYIDKDTEKLTNQEVNEISDMIMIDKIRNNEEEAFLYYDLEEIERMSKGRGR